MPESLHTTPAPMSDPTPQPTTSRPEVPLPTRGTGRTRALHHLATSVREDGTHVWLADPAAWHSDLADSVDRYAAGTTDGLAMLQAANDLIDRRYTTGDTMPRIKVLVDDLPDLLADPEAARLLERLLRTGRKTGIAPEALEELTAGTYAQHPALRALSALHRTR